MKNELTKVYAEVDKILSFLEDEYIKKIPEHIREFFKEEKDKEYEPKIKEDVPLYEQELLHKTKVILAMLNLNYWCNSEKEKEELLKLYNENKIAEENILREIYNPENIFEEKEKRIKQESTDLIEYKKDRFFKKNT